MFCLQCIEKQKLNLTFWRQAAENLIILRQTIEKPKENQTFWRQTI